jgi:hypothetical protein
MQAPDAPVSGKDAAARAAESSDITEPVAPVAPKVATKSVIDEAWFAPLMIGNPPNFRERVLDVLQQQQAKGVVNCAPSLADVQKASFAQLEEVSCLATDGTRFKGEFNVDNDGSLEAVAPDGKTVSISKDGSEFSSKTEVSSQ